MVISRMKSFIRGKLQVLQKLAEVDVLQLWSNVYQRLCPQARFSRASVLSAYHTIIWIFAGLFIALGAVCFMWPLPKTKMVVARTAMYDFQSEEAQRHKIWVSLFAGPQESKDALWLKLRADMDCIGVNARPDNIDGPQVIFRWVKDQAPFSAVTGQILYFGWQATTPCLYASHELAQIGVKILEIQSAQNSASVHLELVKPDAAGQWQSVEQFWIQRDYPKKSPEINQLASLQKMQCRWWGTDLFLLHHTDEQSKDLSTMQRLEVFTSGKQQIFYLGPTQGIILQGKELFQVPLGEASRAKPLYTMEDFDDEGLKMVGWSSSGEFAHHFIVKKQQESWKPSMLQSQIRLAGARSKDVILTQVGEQRWNLRVHDWLLHTPKGWQKIATPSQLDQYVQGLLIGELLIFRELVSEEGQWIARFRLYSNARSQMVDFEVGTANTNAPVPTRRINRDALQEVESNFIPVLKGNPDEHVWPYDDDRAWQPPMEISPQKMLEILKSLHAEEAPLDENES